MCGGPSPQARAYVSSMETWFWTYRAHSHERIRWRIKWLSHSRRGPGEVGLGYFMQAIPSCQKVAFWLVALGMWPSTYNSAEHVFKQMTKNSRAHTQFCHLAPRMAILNTNKKASIGENVGMLQAPDPVGEDVKRHSCCGKQYRSSSEN